MSEARDLVAKKTKHQLSHSFTWPVPIDMAKMDPQEFFAMRMVKGVAMTEGELKSGDLMTRDNVIAGGGAMRASALMGKAQLDIDHYEAELPPSYITKYGKEIAEPYPPGTIVDAQAVENNVDGKNVMQVEFLAIMHNEKVYEMIKQGLIKGCSVVDYSRGLNCTDKCSYQGSAYLSNTLILDEVPNSNGTWVAAVDHNDVGTIIKPLMDSIPDTEAVNKAVNKTPNKSRLEKIITTHMANVTSISEQKSKNGNKTLGKPSLHNLEDYMENGMWFNGITSAQEYLKQEKEIDHDTANAMAVYLMENPDNVSQYQLEHLSHNDLMAWWQSTGLWFKRFNDLTKTVGELRWLTRDNIERLQKTTQSFTKDQVGYKSDQSNQSTRSCKNCRWYVSHNFDKRDEKGHCKIVHGEVRGEYGCDRYAEHTAAKKQCGCDVNKDLDEEQKGIIEDIKDTVEDMPGMEIVEPGAHVDPVPEDGKCPEGYTPSEDGTKCVKPMQSGPVPAHTVQSIHSVIEANPSSKADEQAAALDGEIKKIHAKKDALHRQIAVTPQGHTAARTLFEDLAHLESEITRLSELKKKST